MYLVPQSDAGEGEVEQFTQDNFRVNEDNERILTFRSILPPPDERILDTQEGYNGELAGLPDGHSWALETWGTKWGPHDSETFSTHPELGCAARGTILIVFDTAWSPPIPVIKAWSEKYQNILFELHTEEGGTYTIIDASYFKGMERSNVVRKMEDLSFYELVTCRGG